MAMKVKWRGWRQSVLPYGRSVGVALAVVAGLGVFLHLVAHADEPAVLAPAPAVDPVPAPAGMQTAVLAGGCFWGIQGVFQHVNGVQQALSGYAGGTKVNPSYEDVSSGDTGHAETVKITYDPSKVSYGDLLRIYFSVGQNPTELNYQGPDEGTQYRSDIFYTSDAQKQVAQAYIAQLGAAKVYSQPIVTRVDAYTAFYPAEAYHQDFLTLHPSYPYIVVNDLPKIANLKRLFPDLYSETPVLVGKGKAS